MDSSREGHKSPLPTPVLVEERPVLVASVLRKCSQTLPGPRPHRPHDVLVLLTVRLFLTPSFRGWLSRKK